MGNTNVLLGTVSGSFADLATHTRPYFIIEKL